MTGSNNSRPQYSGGTFTVFTATALLLAPTAAFTVSNSARSQATVPVDGNGKTVHDGAGTFDSTSWIKAWVRSGHHVGGTSCAW